ncbi:MAG TPA: OB-fold domain-containing protein [Acidimicrobiales bacterium]|nr:OB-fold domain-containing protein [Acidimicrobiales bacterium]
MASRPRCRRPPVRSGRPLGPVPSSSSGAGPASRRSTSREACPSCLGADLEFRPAAGTGTVYAMSEMPAPGNAGMQGRAPYVVALVDLPEGVRMLTGIVRADGGLGAAEVAVGDAVRVAWEPLADGRHLPVFVRA